jgi:phytoene/squalene synthetase
MLVTRRVASVTTGIAQYNKAAGASSATVITEYSTSFGLAARLLKHGVRRDVRSIYALVRIADEIVDGAAQEAGLDISTQRSLLDGLEQETEQAMKLGFSTNLVVHAFAITARRIGIDASLTAPFFRSMRQDLLAEPFTEASVAAYIYGSAEVIGLMCLRAFLQRAPLGNDELEDLEELEEGARRLGAAFQKINFLRDLGADSGTLGRNYFPGVTGATMTEEHKHRILDDIDADLEAAERVLAKLPHGCRAAVTSAHRLYARLSTRLRETPANSLMTERVRVPNLQKLAVLAGAALSTAAQPR